MEFQQTRPKTRTATPHWVSTCAQQHIVQYEMLWTIYRLHPSIHPNMKQAIETILYFGQCSHSLLDSLRPANSCHRIISRGGGAGEQVVPWQSDCMWRHMF